ncbi:MAG TPA: alkaline phosphatase family protein [Vicinamibacteria bacterium]|nr:alkaline phosphatase family protein [Vicinamibacteria bacterium]
MLRKTLASTALAACVLAASLVVLVLFLNPGVELRREAAALFFSLFMPGVIAGTVALTGIASLAALFRFWPRATRPPLAGHPWFTTSMLSATTAAAALYWLNLLSYRHSIPVESLRGLFASAVAITGAAVVLFAVGLDSLLFPFRGRAVSAILVVLSPALAVALPLALRPLPAPPAHPVPVVTESVLPLRRITLIGVDGLSPERVREGAADDTLPAFARAMKRGTFGSLATLRPTEGPPLWTTVLTGRLPRDHGVKSFATYTVRGSSTVYELLPKGAFVSLLERTGLVTRVPVTASARRRRTLPEALNAFGITTGLVRIWGTHPAQRRGGFVLSPYFHVLAGTSRAAEALSPPDLLAEVKARVLGPADLDPALLAEFVEPASAATPEEAWLRSDLVERALCPDLTYRRAGELLRSTYDPPFFATYVYGLDVVGHSFLRFARPDRFGDVSTADARRYGRVLPRYEALVAQWIGDAMQGLREGEVLLVVSAYGLEPVPLWRRLLAGALGDRRTSGTHASAPAGFILAVGDGIRQGLLLDQASLVDVAPTILYLSGLPVARDMEGRVLTEMVDDEFARAHPVTFIPSYESLAVAPLQDAPAPLPELAGEGGEAP